MDCNLLSHENPYISSKRKCVPQFNSTFFYHILYYYFPEIFLPNKTKINTKDFLPQNEYNVFEHLITHVRNKDTMTRTAKCNQ